MCTFFSGRWKAAYRIHPKTPVLVSLKRALKTINTTSVFASDHYSLIISALIFANSNKGCTCSAYILWPSLLPPTGLMNTRSLFGRLKPEVEDKIPVNPFYSQEWHYGSYLWLVNSAIRSFLSLNHFTTKGDFCIHLIVHFGLNATIPRTKLHHRNQKQSFSPSTCASLFSWCYGCKTTGS